MDSRGISSTYQERLSGILSDHREFRKHVVPLCAAETPISDFVRQVLTDSIHEKYAMGGPIVPASENFIGADFVLDLHQLTIDLCRDLFGAAYADPRPLSGTAAVTNLLMTISQPGQRILLQTIESGGHSSMAPICRRLGLEIVDLPYDFDRLNVDPKGCRRAAEAGPIDFVLFAPSDILYAPPIASLGLPNSTTVIYDATQTLGLMATGHHPSTLDDHPRLVISGGTHKTLPGPSCGILMTNNEEIANKLDAELSPKFVRHSHPHHIAALCATLIEHREVGRCYSERIHEHARTLSASLEGEGLAVVQDGQRTSETHQVFLCVPSEELDSTYGRAAESGITLNAKRKRLLRGAGLRLGVQEIARYRWRKSDVEQLGALFADLVRGEKPVDQMRAKVKDLATLNEFSPEMCVLPG